MLTVSFSFNCSCADRPEAVAQAKRVNEALSFIPDLELFVNMNEQLSEKDLTDGS